MRHLFLSALAAVSRLFSLVLPGLMLATPGVAAEWMVSVFAGTGVPGSTGDGGPAITAQIHDPFGLVRGPDGALWFCEHNGHRIRRIDAEGRITTVAGTGERGFSGDGGPAVEATLNLPHELRFGPDGNLYIADTGNQVVRRFDLSTGLITTFAGTPNTRGYSGDGGPATAALLDGPHSIQFSPDGGLFICDVNNHTIRRVDLRTGLITTIAGTGRPGPTPDGSPLIGTPFNNPRSLDFDRAGNLWLVTRQGNQVFKLDLDAGRIHLVAGTGDVGFSGHGGPAIDATLNGPKGIALDAAGNVWLVDTENHAIRMIDHQSGTLEWIVGTGTMGDGPDGLPRECSLKRPHGVFIDSDGSVYFGDSEANRIRVLRQH